MPEGSDEPRGLDIVYAVDDGSGSALFAERETAKVAADKCRAMTNSTTWGEFRQAWPDDDFEWCADCFEGDPPDDAEFSRDDLPGLGEGFPEEPWPPDVVVDWFPKDLIEKYGGKERFTDGGSDLFLPAEHAHEIAAELRSRGNVVEESADDLAEWIAYWH